MEHEILIPAVSHEDKMAEFLGGDRIEFIRQFGVPNETFEIESSVFHSWVLSEEITSSFSSSGNPFMNNAWSTNNRSGSSRSKIIEQIIELEFIDNVCIGTNSENIDFSIPEHIGYDEEYYSNEVGKLIERKQQANGIKIMATCSLFLVLILIFS
jgi:hypothetical protein